MRVRRENICRCGQTVKEREECGQLQTPRKYREGGGHKNMTDDELKSLEDDTAEFEQQFKKVKMMVASTPSFRDIHAASADL